MTICGFPKTRVTIVGGPEDKNCSILGCISGSPYSGKLLDELKSKLKVSHLIDPLAGTLYNPLCNPPLRSDFRSYGTIDGHNHMHTSLPRP